MNIPVTPKEACRWCRLKSGTSSADAGPAECDEEEESGGRSHHGRGIARVRQSAAMSA
jgi:hypothetical protein